jgi:hypothetical protein
MTRTELKDRIGKVDGSDTLWGYVENYLNGKRELEERLEAHKWIGGYFGSANKAEAETVFADLDAFEAEKLIADRAQEMAKDEKVIELVRAKFGNDIKAGQDYVYELAIATLFGKTEDK